MPNRTTRTVFTVSAVLALTAAAFAPTAALARGPGGNGECAGDCTAETVSQLQVRARDGSGSDVVQRTQTRASAANVGRAQARTENGGYAQSNRNATQNTNGRGLNANGQGQNAKTGAGQGPNSDGQRGPGTCDECTADMGTLTDEQAAGVLFMANEEKLAHDVYAAFADQYDVRVFANIANAEARHQEAVGVVLERYGLEDTTAGLPQGEFSDPVITSLYTSLMEQGSASLEEALAVGALIEETDIADLESRVEELVESAPDVHQMYSHLLAGSENHLTAFEGWL